ncbi:hypothetical protein EVAR_59971_1 [Eumeta japonica]|uniref:Uncharacterized protein n=1 Tax=Eumeta variegata TaxID=151549 RepID=A0A4C1YW65_EUMVA|nr:hypothetical protein EVAR_59971_1 [Eumeta japonica]
MASEPYNEHSPKCFRPVSSLPSQMRAGPNKGPWGVPATVVTGTLSSSGKNGIACSSLPGENGVTSLK